MALHGPRSRVTRLLLNCDVTWVSCAALAWWWGALPAGCCRLQFKDGDKLPMLAWPSRVQKIRWIHAALPETKFVSAVPLLNRVTCMKMCNALHFFRRFKHSGLAAELVTLLQ